MPRRVGAGLSVPVRAPAYALPVRRQRVMVTGSRHWDDAQAIFNRLAKLDRSTVIVHGAARLGADAIADRAARRLGLACDPLPAKWRVDGIYNPRAGFERNDQMLDSGVVLVLAFRAGGMSNGTDHAIRGARQRGIEVEVHRPSSCPTG